MRNFPATGPPTQERRGKIFKKRKKGGAGGSGKFEKELFVLRNERKYASALTPTASVADTPIFFETRKKSSYTVARDDKK